MAHRGFSQEGLENTMAAFRAAVELGFRYLETDVHTTADGVLLLFHDDTLDRITDGRGRISELPAETVERERIGGAEHIPRFEELATAFPDVRFNLDVKDWNSVDPLAAAIERFGLHDRVLARTPAARWGAIDDFAGIAVFLASPASDFVTGTAIPVDGGYSVMA